MKRCGWCAKPFVPYNRGQECCSHKCGALLRRWREMRERRDEVLRANGIAVEKASRRGEATEL